MRLSKYTTPNIYFEGALFFGIIIIIALEHAREKICGYVCCSCSKNAIEIAGAHILWLQIIYKYVVCQENVSF